MKPPPFTALILGICFLAFGVLVVQTAMYPRRNSLTKMLYWLMTLLPRVGSLADEKWVMINGIAMLVVGLALCALWIFGAA